MSTKTLLAATASLALAGSATAASFTTDFQGTLMSEQASSDIGGDGAGERAPYRVSVNPANAGYASGDRFNNPDGTAGTPFERDFSDPVVGYSFIGGGQQHDLHQPLGWRRHPL